MVMVFKFVTRSSYRNKTEPDFINDLYKEFSSFYLVPEGGTNALAVKGCESILTKKDKNFDYLCTAIGTGGTISGIINSAFDKQFVLGFPALKGDFLKEDIKKYCTNNSNWKLITDYHFGGYGKISEELIHFINWFKTNTQIPLDPVYTGKMIFGLLDLIKKDYFHAGTKILAIHTGGLQGVEGMNTVLTKKGLSLIK